MTRNFRYLEGLAIAPGLLLFLAILSGCSDGVETPASDDLCFSEVTPITAIQGDGYYSPLEDSYQLVSGWVTLIEPGGYYIEQSGGDRQERSSRALFVEKHREARNLQIGQLVVAGGKVEETGERRDKMTSLVAIDRFARCESSLPLPLSHARLPLSNPEREALEGMRGPAVASSPRQDRRLRQLLVIAQLDHQENHLVRRALVSKAEQLSAADDGLVAALPQRLT